MAVYDPPPPCITVDGYVLFDHVYAIIIYKVGIKVCLYLQRPCGHSSNVSAFVYSLYTTGRALAFVIVGVFELAFRGKCSIHLED
jgi:hypothetical protein